MPAGSAFNFAIAVPLVLYVVGPLLVLIHELGHASAVVRAGRRPMVVVGKTPPLFARRFRTFDLAFHPRLPLSHFYPRTPWQRIPKTYVGLCRYDPRGLKVRELRSISSAGPHVSIIAGLCLGALTAVLPAGSVAFWVAALGAFSALLDGFGNLVPRKQHGRLFSDGARMSRLRNLDAETVVAPTGPVADRHYPPAP
jgi:hypothetical protein